MVNRFAEGGILDVVAKLVEWLEAVTLLPDGVAIVATARTACIRRWNSRPTPSLSAMPSGGRRPQNRRTPLGSPGLPWVWC